MKDRDQAVGELRRSPLLVTASSVSHRPDVGYQEAVRLCRLRCRLTAYSCCVDGGVTPLFVNAGCSRGKQNRRPHLVSQFRCRTRTRSTQYP